MRRIALSTPRERSDSTRSLHVALVVVALVALVGVAVSGAAVADGGPAGESATLAQDDVTTFAAEINVTDRTVTDTEVGPGGTTTVEVFVDTDGELGDTSLVEVTDQFSSAFANVELNESDPAPAGAAPGPNNEEFFSIWNVDRPNYNVSYDVTIPTTAENGDTYQVTGTIDVGDEQQALPSETITVSTDIPEETNVELEPADQTASTNGQTTFDVVVTGAGSGVGSYSINVSSSDVSVGEIAGITHTNTPATDSSQIASDGSWGLVEADLGNNDHAKGFSITVAQVTVDTGSAGTSDLTVDSSASVSNSTGDAYSINSVSGATLTVQEPATFELSNLNPQTATVNAGQTFDVSADVTNTGGQSGEQDIELSLEPGGSVVDTQTVSLSVGETQTVTFQDESVSQTGSYNHTVATDDDQLVGTLTVEESPAPPGFDPPPQDLDGDGLFEDVDGDGDFDIFDVQALFNGLNSDPVQNSPAAFNFNRDDNPTEVTIFDVQGLFNML